MTMDKSLKARRGFFIHLGIYLIVNILLFAQWAIVTPGASYWPVWTTLGWGIGVAFHGLARIEVEPPEIPKLSSGELAKKIVVKLRSLGYNYVTLDLEGFRSGSLDLVLKKNGDRPSGKF